MLLISLISWLLSEGSIEAFMALKQNEPFKHHGSWQSRIVLPLHTLRRWLWVAPLSSAVTALYIISLKCPLEE